EAREIFGEVDEALKQNLSRLMFEGPADELTLTENAQPALMAMSLAVVKVLEKQANITIRNTARYVAGHSLGEYSALAAAGAMLLPVSAPFHCPLMKPAAEVMAQALTAIAIKPPAVPVIANVTAATVIDPDEIRHLLIEQVTGMVRWRESVNLMKEAGVDTLI